MKNKSYEFEIPAFAGMTVRMPYALRHSATASGTGAIHCAIATDIINIENIFTDDYDQNIR